MASKKSEFLELILISDEPHKVTDEEIAVQAIVTYYSGASPVKTKRQLKPLFESMETCPREDLLRLLKEIGLSMFREGYDDEASVYLTAAVKFQDEFLPKPEWKGLATVGGNGTSKRDYLPRA